MSHTFKRVADHTTGADHLSGCVGVPMDRLGLSHPRVQEMLPDEDPPEGPSFECPVIPLPRNGGR